MISFEDLWDKLYRHRNTAAFFNLEIIIPRRNKDNVYEQKINVPVRVIELSTNMDNERQATVVIPSSLEQYTAIVRFDQLMEI